MTKSVEQKLFEAWTKHRGCRLSERDITDLITVDDAIRTRISNAAAGEAGAVVPGADCIDDGETWAQFKRRLSSY